MHYLPTQIACVSDTDGVILPPSQLGTVLAYWLDYGTIKRLSGEVSDEWAELFTANLMVIGGLEIPYCFSECLRPSHVSHPSFIA